MNIDDCCGYCPNCKEFKDDDYGQWKISEDSRIETVRGCRDCGHTLTSMETVKAILPELLNDLEKQEKTCTKKF